MMMMICLVTSSSHPHQHSIIPWISVVFIRLSVPSYYARWRQRKLPATANLITSLSPWVVCPASRVSLGGLTAMARSVLRYFFSPFVLLRLLFYFQPKDSNRWLTSGWEIFIGVGCCCFGGGPEPQRQLTPVASKVEKKTNKKTRKETKQKEEQKKKKSKKKRRSDRVGAVLRFGIHHACWGSVCAVPPGNRRVVVTVLSAWRGILVGQQ